MVTSRRAAIRTTALLLFLLPAARAAAQGNQPPGNQPPGTPPPAGQGQGQDPAGPALRQEGDEFVFSMSETGGMDIKEFIKWGQEITDKRFFLNESELNSVTGGPRVTFLGTYRFPKATFERDFYSFFQTMLFMKGFALLPRGAGNLEINEIVFMGGPRARDVTNGARLVAVEEIEEYRNQTGVPILTTVPLKNINATIAQNALRPFFAQGAGGPGGGTQLMFGTAGNSSSLLLQGFGPQVHDAVRLLRLVDTPTEAPDLVTQVHRLEWAAPEELEPILTEILDNRQRVRQAALAEAGAQGASGAPLQVGQQGQMKVIVNPALRAIILSGTAEQVRDALELVARLDVPPEPVDGQASVYKLKNVLAEDLAQTLQQFTQQDQQAETQAQAGQPGAGAARRPRPTVIRAHVESNSLLISASQTKYKQITALIDELDKKQPQVLIEAALVELTTGDLARFGVELGLIDLKDDGDFTRPFGFTSGGLSAFQDTDDDGIPDTRLPDFDNPLQGLTGGIISGGDFAVPVLLNALASDERANILSMPSVLVNNNETATVVTQEQRPTVSSQQGTATTQQSVGAPREAGITLAISPTISPNNYLRLNLNLEVSRFVGAFDPNSVTGGGVILSRNISTQVTMPSGDTMVLGGVVEDSESYIESGVPFLKDIPLLGFLFRRSENTANKTNLYFFVTPTILDEDDFNDLWQVSLQRKMDAERYIGTRRLRIIDRKWVGEDAAKARTLEDPGATIEDLDAQSGSAMPYYRRPEPTPVPGVGAPNGPKAPDQPAGRNGR